MKRAVFLLIIILLTILAAYLVFFRGKSTLGSRGTLFALNDRSQVSEIIIESGNEELRLYRSGEKWLTDDAEVDKQIMLDLLLLNENIEILSPAPISSIDSITDCLDTGKSIHFISGNKTLLAYRICTFNRQLFARKIGASKIFRIASRGFSDVDLSQLLSTEKSFWMGNILISLNPADIRLVNVRYMQEITKDFALFSEGDKIAVKGSKEELSYPEINKGFVSDYLQFFSAISFEKPQDEKLLLEAIQQELPYFSLQIINALGEETKLAGFRIPAENTPGFNPYKFCAITVEGECILLNYSDFDPVLVSFQDFLKN